MFCAFRLMYSTGRMASRSGRNQVREVVRANILEVGDVTHVVAVVDLLPVRGVEAHHEVDPVVEVDDKLEQVPAAHRGHVEGESIRHGERGCRRGR